MDTTSTISSSATGVFHDGLFIPTDRSWHGKQPVYRDGSQKQRILALLLSRSFVPLNELMDLRIADYHRVMDFMKDDGYLIKCYSKMSGGIKHATYVLNGFDETKKRIRRHQSWYAQQWHVITETISKVLGK